MIHNIETLPYVTLIKIIETGNTRLLIKKRYFKWIDNIRLKFSKIDTEKEFDQIKEDYSDKENSVRRKKIESLQKKLRRLTSKYEVVILALEVLRRGKDDEMMAILKKHGYTIEGDYSKGLMTVYKQTENLKNQIKTIEGEIKKYTGSKGDGKADAYKILVNLTVQLGLSLKSNEITVIEFVHYKQALSAKIKQSKKNGK